MQAGENFSDGRIYPGASWVNRTLLCVGYGPWSSNGRCRGLSLRRCLDRRVSGKSGGCFERSDCRGTVVICRVAVILPILEIRDVVLSDPQGVEVVGAPGRELPRAELPALVGAVSAAWILRRCDNGVGMWDRARVCLCLLSLEPSPPPPGNAGLVLGFVAAFSSAEV